MDITRYRCNVQTFLLLTAVAVLFSGCSQAPEPKAGQQSLQATVWALQTQVANQAQAPLKPTAASSASNSEQTQLQEYVTVQTIALQRGLPLDRPINIPALNVTVTDHQLQQGGILPDGRQIVWANRRSRIVAVQVLRPIANDDATTPEPAPIPENTADLDSPTAVAEGFVHAAIASDFPKVLQYFPPDRQPNSWADVYTFNGLRYSETLPNAMFDGALPKLQNCLNVSYTITERPGTSGGIQVDEVSFVFGNQCIWRPSTVRDNNDKRGWSSKQIVVSMDKSTGRWYIAPVTVGGSSDRLN